VRQPAAQTIASLLLLIMPALAQASAVFPSESVASEHVIPPGAASTPPTNARTIDDSAGRPGDEAANFTVRDGYAVSVAVETVPGARFLAFDDSGTLFVSRPGRGDVLAFRDEDGDGKYERREVFISGRPKVHGLCFSGGFLWFATSGAIGKARDTDQNLRADEITDIIPDGQLPQGGGHWYRSLLVTNDTIYTSIGDSGNISDQEETERQKIWAFGLDGTGKRLFASGIRNNEELLMRPGTQELWGVDHGGDWFGAPLGEFQGNQAITDLNPPDEFNRYIENGFYGHPFLTGNRVPRFEHRERSDLLELAAKTIAPEWNIPAHWAANAFCFIETSPRPGPGAMPADHTGDAFVACRGSWNSTKPVGYCIARVLFDQGRPYGQLTIVSTLQESEKPGGPSVVLARPVDCVQAPDGTVLFSSDQPGRIYRVSRIPVNEYK